MAVDSARVLPFPPQEDLSAVEDAPFIPTSLARALCARMEDVHQRQAIGVFAGPWGIGKTRAIHAFADEHENGVVVVNVEPGSNQKGRTPVATMQLISEAFLRRHGHWGYGAPPSSSHQVLRNQLFNHAWDELAAADGAGRLTLVFDEAQNLSRSAIEMLRFWNDRQQAAMPRPVGLIFVGNQEFALEEDATGQSVISGAVRSRARFIGSFSYDDLTQDDIGQIVMSRGVSDPTAVAEIIEYFCRRDPRIRRDLRQIVRVVEDCRLRAEGAAVTAEIARRVLFRQ